jgi:hypothetical protein
MERFIAAVRKAQELDIEIWEPKKFTDELAELAQDLRDAIAYCKEWEARYVQAKAELKEVQA